MGRELEREQLSAISWKRPGPIGKIVDPALLYHRLRQCYPRTLTTVVVDCSEYVLDNWGVEVTIPPVVVDPSEFGIELPSASWESRLDG